MFPSNGPRFFCLNGTVTGMPAPPLSGSMWRREGDSNLRTRSGFLSFVGCLCLSIVRRGAVPFHMLGKTRRVKPAWHRFTNGLPGWHHIRQKLTLSGHSQRIRRDRPPRNSSSTRHGGRTVYPPF